MFKNVFPYCSLSIIKSNNATSYEEKHLEFALILECDFSVLVTDTFAKIY